MLACSVRADEELNYGRRCDSIVWLVPSFSSSATETRCHPQSEVVTPTLQWQQEVRIWVLSLVEGQNEYSEPSLDKKSTLMDIINKYVKLDHFKNSLHQKIYIQHIFCGILIHPKSFIYYLYLQAWHKIISIVCAILK